MTLNTRDWDNPRLKMAYLFCEPQHRIFKRLREWLIGLFDKDVHVSLVTGEMQRNRFRRDFRKFRYNPISGDLWRGE